MNLADLIIIILLLLGAAGGYRKGLLASVVGFVGSLFGFFMAYRFYPLLANWVEDQLGLKTKLFQFFKAHLILPQPVSNFNIHKPLAELSSALDKLTLSGGLKEYLLKYLQLPAPANPTSTVMLGDVINQFLSTVLINGLAFIAIWFVIDLGIKLILASFTGIFGDTALGLLNKAGGLFAGTIFTVLTLTIVIGLLQPLAALSSLSAFPFWKGVGKAMEGSLLVPYFVSFFSLLAAKISGLLLLK